MSETENMELCCLISSMATQSSHQCALIILWYVHINYRTWNYVKQCVRVTDSKREPWDATQVTFSC